MLAALDGDRHVAVLARLEEGAASPRFVEEETALASLWARELRRLRRAASELDSDSPDDALHEARIRTKRARYAAELAEGELGKPGRRFVDAAKRLQDVLGEHQDAVVAEERIRALLTAAKAPAAHRAGGRLIGRERMRRARARNAFPSAWRRLDRAGRKAAKAA